MQGHAWARNRCQLQRSPERAARSETGAQRRFRHPRSLGPVAFVGVNWLRLWDTGVQTLFGLFLTLTKAFWSLLGMVI